MHFEAITRHRRLVFSGSVLAGVILLGTVGYTVIEGWTLLEGLYMSVITLSTVGYGETRELSIVGRFFTLGLIVLSISSLAFWTASLSSVFIESDMSGANRKRRSIKMAATLHDHTIVCGSNVMAQSIVERLTGNHKPVVVVTNNSEEAEVLRRRYRDLALIEDDPTNELSLASANILMASTVVTVLDNDFDNLMIAMTCKELGPHLQVIARSNNPRIASRLHKLGVEQVICPLQMSGNFVAQQILDAEAPTS